MEHDIGLGLGVSLRGRVFRANRTGLSHRACRSAVSASIANAGPETIAKQTYR